MSTRRAVVAALLGLPLAEALAQEGARPKEWATPLALEGAPNLHQVEKNFFRSAQPDATGFKGLSTTHGVRTVISLRAFNADEPLAAGLDLTLARVRINTWNIRRKDVVTALQDLRRASRDAPVLLHCQHGADRTGMITALYRVLETTLIEGAGSASIAARSSRGGVAPGGSSGSPSFRFRQFIPAC